MMEHHKTGSSKDVVICVGFMWQPQVVMVWVTATLALKATQVRGGQLIKCEPSEYDNNQQYFGLGTGGKEWESK